MVEVLVVVLILVALAAVLAPVFAHAKDAARRARCLSHLRRLGEALLLYKRDSDNTFALAMPSDGVRWLPRTPASGINSFWANAIRRYAPDSTYYICPIAEADASTAPALSYAYNGYLHQYPASEVADPPSAILLWEGFGKLPNYSDWFSNPSLACGPVSEPCIFNTGSDPKGIYIMPQANTMWVHGRGANFLLADGHAQWRRLGPKAGKPTNRYRDPVAVYDRKGIPQEVWMAEHPDVDAGFAKTFLFRPTISYGTD